MKNLFTHSALLLIASLLVAPLTLAQAKTKSKTPALLAPYLTKGKAVKGEVGHVVPPKEIRKFINKVREAVKKDPEWRKEYVKKAVPGQPLPWHEKLGLTKQEYQEYLKLWDAREFKAVKNVIIHLEEPKPGEWMIRVSGVGMPISLLRYNSTAGNFKSPNGELKRIDDISADARSILGEWKGQEWKHERETDLASTEENIAIGKFKDGKHCVLIYRFVESSGDLMLANKSLIIRFSPPGK